MRARWFCSGGLQTAIVPRRGTDGALKCAATSATTNCDTLRGPLAANARAWRGFLAACSNSTMFNPDATRRCPISDSVRLVIASSTHSQVRIGMLRPSTTSCAGAISSAIFSSAVSSPERASGLPSVSGLFAGRGHCHLVGFSRRDAAGRRIQSSSASAGG